MSKDDHNFEIDLGEDLDSHSFYNAKNQSKGPGNNSSGDSRSNRGSDYSNDSQSGGNSWDGNSNQGGYNNNNFQYNKGGYQGNNYNPNYHKNNMGGGNNNFYNQAGGGQSSLNKSATPTSAILVENLNWWVNEEDVRNWVAESGQDGDLKTVIFDEHKVNGKSKGVVYVEFRSIPGANQAKSYIEESIAKGKDADELSAGPPIQACYYVPSFTPFRIQTNKFNNNGNNNMGGGFHNQSHYVPRGGGRGGRGDMRGGRGGYLGRGGYMGGGRMNNGPSSDNNGGSNPNMSMGGMGMNPMGMGMMGGFPNMPQFNMMQQGRGGQQGGFPNFPGGFNFGMFQGQAGQQGGPSGGDGNDNSGGGNSSGGNNDWNSSGYAGNKRARHE